MATLIPTPAVRGSKASAAPGLESPAFRRWIVFVHQDGVILCPTIRALAEVGVLEPSLQGERCIAELVPELPAAGYANLRVGLRTLASQGWLEDCPPLDPERAVLRWTAEGRLAARYWDRYAAAGRFLGQFSSNRERAWERSWTGRQAQAFLDLLPLACERWGLGDGLDERQRALMTTHLDAALAVPSLLWLRSTGALGGEAPVLPGDEVGAGIGQLLSALRLTNAEGRWTASGRQVAELSVHFGMAASYLPLLARLPELYRGERVVAAESDDSEWHVHRGLNVTASAAAHTRYFRDADRIFLELFDREPLDRQPRFIADMGCGDGSWLVHLYELIGQHTLRGRRLDTHPLVMVGLDYNAAALDRAREVVDGAGVPSLLLPGDISDPDAVSATLAEHGLAMDDGLHVRAFIDHDRHYLGGDPSVEVRSSSTGAYVDPAGMPLTAVDAERDLVAHLERWTPHIRKHGLVMLEAHCVAPWIAREHLGASHSVAFDSYHGYSNQYPLEHAAFLECCRTAGLRPVTDCERRYPANRPFVAVSLNRMVVAERLAELRPGAAEVGDDGTWSPDPATDLEDGRALHRLLYVDGDVRHPRLWCSAPTGFVVAGALRAIEERLANARRGDIIRVLDYGAGTGLATIELLKAYHERGIEERVERAGARVELHMVDLPSSWFAQGFELLHDCGLVRFHSLRAPGGGFRPLKEVVGGRAMDAVMANMVFHLIPSRALERVAAELAGVTREGGSLYWNAPDLGPPGAYAVLFHDANRTVRRRWLELVSGERPLHAAALPRTAEAVALVRASLDVSARAAAQARADRRILREANAADDVARILGASFGGDGRLHLPTYELLADDVLDTLCVPSNQSEYLPEIEDRDLREDVIRELLLEDVLPEIQRSPAGTAEGLNVQWALGSARRADH